MKLVIPMSGKGNRFVNVGYQTLKPLIEVEGKPIIAHVLDMFPGENDVIFVCNEEHLANTNMEQVLKTLKPDSVIVPVKGKQKGPVADISHAFDLIKDAEDVMVSYCDFTQKWDYQGFKDSLQTKPVAGAVPAYTGFHPHLLRGNVYAGILADQDNLMLDIKEKNCFTESPEDSYHSSGAYYFSSGALLKKYANELMAADININGEYYVSMIYYLLLRDKLPVAVPPVTHFMQWGTPEDLEEYEAWSRAVHAKLNLQKELTEIPTARENLVVIPYREDSPEFKKSLAYWSDLFRKEIS